jgi:hypothetical protein
VVAFLYIYFLTKDNTSTENRGYFSVPEATIFLRLYGLLKDLMDELPNAFSAYGDIKISLNRIDKFLGSKEVQASKYRNFKKI